MVRTPFYLLLLLHLLPFQTFAQNNGTIALGSTLTATEGAKPWLSPSGNFAFGFSQLKGTNQFLLCIWYAKINERTIVWHAYTDSPVPQGSKLQLEVEGLFLLDPKGNTTLWRTEAFVGKVDHGVLYDTGKFALFGSDSAVLWDSFAHPTDTLLPTQEMEIGTMLISPRSEANFSPGRFYLQLLDTGNLVLSTKSVPTNKDYDVEYYNSRTSDPFNPANSGYKLIFSDKGSISILKRNNSTVELISLSNSIVVENYLRLTLNFDGVLALYRYPKGGNQSWTSLWHQPDNICRAIAGSYGSGACGYNSVCSLDANNRPSCECPPGYSLLDPSDKHGSCTRNFVQTCEGAAGEKGSSADLYDFIEIANTNWPFNDMEHINPCSKDECKIACLNDCLCDVAIYGGSGCWKKRLPLSNGVKETSGDTIALFKVRKARFQ